LPFSSGSTGQTLCLTIQIRRSADDPKSRFQANPPTSRRLSAVGRSTRYIITVMIFVTVKYCFCMAFMVVAASSGFIPRVCTRQDETEMDALLISPLALKKLGYIYTSQRSRNVAAKPAKKTEAKIQKISKKQRRREKEKKKKEWNSSLEEAIVYAKKIPRGYSIISLA